MRNPHLNAMLLPEGPLERVQVLGVVQPPHLRADGLAVGEQRIDGRARVVAGFRDCAG